MGTGIGAECAWRDICVLNYDNGKPYVEIAGSAEKSLQNLNIKNIHVSITHTDEYAAAVVILEN